jgi:hypothetical protein
MCQVRGEDFNSGYEFSIYALAVICFTAVVYDWGEQGIPMKMIICDYHSLAVTLGQEVSRFMSLGPPFH